MPFKEVFYLRCQKIHCIYFLIYLFIDLIAVMGCSPSSGTPEKAAPSKPEEKGYAVEDKFVVPDTIILNTMILDPEAQADWIDYTDGIPIQNGRFEPLDQADLNPHFILFKDSMLQALQQKDTAFLLGHIGDKIAMSFDVEQTKAEFINNWNLQSAPENSSLWGVLIEVLEMGGLFSSSEFNFFICPYTFFLSVENPYAHKAVVGTEVRIRNKPGLEGAVLGSLNFEIVEGVPLDPGETPVEQTIGGEIHTWEKVKTSNGNVGYVYGKFLKSPIDFRAFFAFQQDKWMLSTLVAGD